MSGLRKRGEIQEQGRIEVRYALPMLDLMSPTFAMNTTTVLGTLSRICARPFYERIYLRFSAAVALQV